MLTGIQAWSSRLPTLAAIYFSLSSFHYLPAIYVSIYGTESYTPSNGSVAGGDLETPSPLASGSLLAAHTTPHLESSLLSCCVVASCVCGFVFFTLFVFTITMLERHMELEVSDCKCKVQRLAYSPNVDMPMSNKTILCIQSRKS